MKDIDEVMDFFNNHELYYYFREDGSFECGFIEVEEEEDNEQEQEEEDDEYQD